MIYRNTQGFTYFVNINYMIEQERLRNEYKKMSNGYQIG